MLSRLGLHVRAAHQSTLPALASSLLPAAQKASCSSCPPAHHCAHKTAPMAQGHPQLPRDICTSTHTCSDSQIGRVQPTLAMLYTCSKCGNRSAAKFSHQAYKQGVVLIRCPGCKNLHLISDNLGWFGDKGWNVERLIEAQKSSQGAGASANSQDEQQSDPPSPSAAAQDDISASSSSEEASSDAEIAITERDLEGYQRVQQLFELAMRDSGSKAKSSRLRGKLSKAREVWKSQK